MHLLPVLYLQSVFQITSARRLTRLDKMGLVLPRRRMVPGLLSAAAILYLAPSASAKGPSSAGDAPAKSEKPSELDSLKEQLAKKTDVLIVQ